MDPLTNLLANLGLNIGANFIYDKLKQYYASSSDPFVAGLSNYLASSLQIDGAEIQAQKIIEVLAQSGIILIQNSKVHSKKSITYSSVAGSTFQLRDNVVSTTASGSYIGIGQGASATGQGGGQIIQDEEGNITIKA